MNYVYQKLIVQQLLALFYRPCDLFVKHLFLLKIVRYPTLKKGAPHLYYQIFLYIALLFLYLSLK
ncbi:Uncharacterised protein [Streptococcus pneumoniae]|nr:Uncharacterised protein [Streptococcus pneumoniae]